MAGNPLHWPIDRYHQGLIGGDPEAVLAALGPDLFMFNGNFSGNPADWQAHLYLTGPALLRWVASFVTEAGPHANQWEFIHAHTRGQAAIVVTRETGRNRFRAWTGEVVTWLLGQRGGEWRIMGYFVRDLRNPD